MKPDGITYLYFMKIFRIILIGIMMFPIVCPAQNFKREAKKEAKSFEKDGWVTSPGSLPLQIQFQKAYEMQAEKDESGYPKYITGEAMSIGENFDAAKMQALELAKLNLASIIQTELTTLVNNSLANEQLEPEEAESITRTITENTNIISQSLGRVIIMAECYRTLKNKNKEVLVRIACNAELAMEAGKKAIRKNLESKGEELREKLDELMWL